MGGDSGTTVPAVTGGDTGDLGGFTGDTASSENREILFQSGLIRKPVLYFLVQSQTTLNKTVPGPQNNELTNQSGAFFCMFGLDPGPTHTAATFEVP